MDSSTSRPRPEWLNDWQIAEFRKDLKECPNPYTDEEAIAMELDDPTFDMARSNAHLAKKILTEYGIPLTEEEENGTLDTKD